MTSDVVWPAALSALWNEIFECVRCGDDERLRELIDLAHYVPLKTVGILPPGRSKATYLIVGGEPSGWDAGKNRSESIAQQRSRRGVRNFNETRADFALQFAVERWLLGPGESYYITDLAKCRVQTGKIAARTADDRYRTCAPWLDREIRELAPQAIIAAGRPAFSGARSVRQTNWPPLLEIGHWGQAGVAHWKKYANDGLDTIPELTELAAFAAERWELSSHRGPTAKRPGRFPPSYQWLLTMYRTQFTAIRAALTVGSTSKGVTLEIPGGGGMRMLL